jgi:DNA replication and repair protein RecF
VRLNRLTLRNFRNYSELDLSIPSGIVVFVGDNGQGKTNLIEAIHLLFRGESFRTKASEVLVRQIGQEPAAHSLLKATLEKKSLNYEVQWTSKLGQRKLECNGKKTSGVHLARTFPLVLFSPESLAAIKEGPDLRRRLVDEVLITHSAAGAEILKDFNKALRSRNRLIKDCKKGHTSEAQTRRLLESLDPIFLPLAGELTALRIQALQALAADLQTAVRSVLQSREPVQIEYLMSGRNVSNWARPQIIEAMHQRAIELRPRELEAGLSLVGPHRHDIRFLFAGKDSRYFCSQGQQRALILSYKMAQIMYHHRTHQVFPFLLLDDVLSELDPDRRTNLMRFLKALPAPPGSEQASQIFLTTTDLSFSLDFGDRNLSVFQIEKGVISSAGNNEGLRRSIDSSPRGP